MNHYFSNHHTIKKFHFLSVKIFHVTCNKIIQLKAQSLKRIIQPVWLLIGYSNSYHAHSIIWCVVFTCFHVKMKGGF